MGKSFLPPCSWLTDRLARVRKAQAELSFIYPAAGLWHLIHGARTLGVVEAPHDAWVAFGRELAASVMRPTLSDALPHTPAAAAPRSAASSAAP